MSSIEPELQVLYNIGNALVREFPYPHLYVPDVFPADFYREMLRNLPPQSALKNLGELGRVTAGNTYTMVGKFAPYLAQRFGDLRNIRFDHEALIVRDRTNYALGPHTDSPSKVLSFLFYLPADAARAHLGTSIYVPRDPGFLCQGGPHYDYAKFQRMLTLPYVPNALFAFMKTPNSFHGVEPIAEPEVRRDLLLYDLRVLPPQAQKPAPAAASNIKFTI
jgi:hypothetical protein